MISTTIAKELEYNRLHRQRPFNVNQLVGLSGVARETILKIQDGDYSVSNVGTINRVFKVFGLQAIIRIEESNHGSDAGRSSL